MTEHIPHDRDRDVVEPAPDLLDHDNEDRYDKGQAPTAPAEGDLPEERYDEGQAATSDVESELPEARFDEGQAVTSDVEAELPEGRFDEGQGSTYGEPGAHLDDDPAPGTGPRTDP